jgi:hypothetical protein
MGDEDESARGAAGGAPSPPSGKLPRREIEWQDVDAPEPLTLRRIVAGAAAVFGIFKLNSLTGGLLDHFSEDSDPNPGPRNKGPNVVPPDLRQTAAPAFDADGLAACSRCQRRVAFASMAINEHGYFCARCGPSRPR